MSSALGGLLDRALKSYLSKASGPNANANPAEADKRYAFVMTCDCYLHLPIKWTSL